MKPLFSSHIFDGNKQNKLNIRKLCVLTTWPSSFYLHTINAMLRTHPLFSPQFSSHRALHPLRLLPHQGRLPGACHGPPRRPRQGPHRSLLAPCLRGGHTGMRRALHQEQARPLHHAPRLRHNRHRPRGAVHPHRLKRPFDSNFFVDFFLSVQDNRDGSRLFLIP
ncbi:unnamed protein product [Musa hybrid cultivar]